MTGERVLEKENKKWNKRHRRENQRKDTTAINKA
jgi:hypothetical protein